jgi:hypothetical protein
MNPGSKDFMVHSSAIRGPHWDFDDATEKAIV